MRIEQAFKKTFGCRSNRKDSLFLFFFVAFEGQKNVVFLSFTAQFKDKVTFEVYLNVILIPRHCDSRYVGRTCQTLQDRIKQHVPNLSVLALLPKNAYFLLVGANLPLRLIPSLLLLIQPLDFIFYKILPALNIMMTADFLFLPKAAHISIYLLLKPLSSKLLIPSSADKKNSCTA